MSIESGQMHGIFRKITDAIKENPKQSGLVAVTAATYVINRPLDGPQCVNAVAFLAGIIIPISIYVGRGIGAKTDSQTQDTDSKS